MGLGQRAVQARTAPPADTPGDQKARRQRCDEVIAALTLPRPFSVRDFCQSVGAAVGKPIRLHAVDPASAGVGVHGVLVETDHAHHIFFVNHGGLIAEAATIVHECGHILMPDLDDAAAPSSFVADVEATVDLFAVRVLSAVSLGLGEAAADGPDEGAHLAAGFG